MPSFSSLLLSFCFSLPLRFFIGLRLYLCLLSRRFCFPSASPFPCAFLSVCNCYYAFFLVAFAFHLPWRSSGKAAIAGKYFGLALMLTMGEQRQSRNCR